MLHANGFDVMSLTYQDFNYHTNESGSFPDPFVFYDCRRAGCGGGQLILFIRSVKRPASFLVRAYTKRHYGHDLRLLSEKAGVVSTNEMLTLERLIAGARKRRPVPTPTAQSCGLESVPSALRVPPLPCLRPYPDNVTNFVRNSVTGAPHYKR